MDGTKETPMEITIGQLMAETQRLREEITHLEAKNAELIKILQSCKKVLGAQPDLIKNVTEGRGDAKINELLEEINNISSITKSK